MKRHIDFLDAFRGIAVLSVLFFHTIGQALGYDENFLPWEDWFKNQSNVFRFVGYLPETIGQMGVPLFFIISGFCIHLSFECQGRNWKSFFVRRFWRIYPAYFAALIFSFMLLRLQFPIDFLGWDFWKQLITHVFLFFNFFPSTVSTLSICFWSLAVEAQLYLLYPVLLYLVKKFGWRNMIIALAVGETVIRAAGGMANTGGLWVLYHSPFCYWFSWAAGAFVADAYLKNQPLPFRKLNAGWILLFGIFCFYIKPLYPFRFEVFALLSAIILSKTLSNPQIKFPKVLNSFGLWSYSIYLLHYPIIVAWSGGMARIVPIQYQTVLTGVMMIFVSWLVIVPASILWYKIFEAPMIALGKKFAQRKLKIPIATIPKEASA